MKRKNEPLFWISLFITVFFIVGNEYPFWSDYDAVTLNDYYLLFSNLIKAGDSFIQHYVVNYLAFFIYWLLFTISTTDFRIPKIIITVFIFLLILFPILLENYIRYWR
jgi:hypothetical protein